MGLDSAQSPPRRTGVTAPETMPTSNASHMACRLYPYGDPELLDYDSVSQATALEVGNPREAGPAALWTLPDLGVGCLNQAEVDLLGVGRGPVQGPNDEQGQGAATDRAEKELAGEGASACLGTPAPGSPLLGSA